MKIALKLNRRMQHLVHGHTSATQIGCSFLAQSPHSTFNRAYDGDRNLTSQLGLLVSCDTLN